MLAGKSLSIVGRGQAAPWYGQYRGTLRNFKVALVHPYLKEAHNKNRLKFRESLALGYLTASLEAYGIEVVSINAELRNLGTDEVAAMLLADPDIQLVGISAKSQRTYAGARDIANRLKVKRPDLHITIGGVFPTAADKLVLQDSQQFDSIVRGEGEIGLVELAFSLALERDLRELSGFTYRIDGRIVATEKRPRIDDLDSLAFPARRDLAWVLENGGEADASAYMVASRGCYASCTFCSIHQIYGDHLVKRRSPGSILDEMQQITRQYGIRRFSFVDDLFITPSQRGVQWVHDFCDEIDRRNMDINFYAEMRADTVDAELVRKLKRAGLHRLFLGIESGVDSVLKRWDKGVTVAQNDAAILELKKVGLKPHMINFGYIMFGPEMTLEELKHQYLWLRNSGHAKVQHLQNKMNVYWGTPQHRRMLALGKKDNTPLGGRWAYEFDDSRVGAVEAAIRRFHARVDAESEDYLVAQEMFRRHVKVHDSGAQGVPEWADAILSQALNRLNQTERDAYYYMFDNLIGWAELHGEVPPSLESQLWENLAPLLDQLRQESVLLTQLIEQMRSIDWRDQESTAAPGVGFRSLETQQAYVWVANSKTDRANGFLVGLALSPVDRFDHRCEVVTFKAGREGASHIERSATLRGSTLPQLAAPRLTVPPPVEADAGSQVCR